MRILRVGYLALGLAPLAVPALAQEGLRLFAPAPRSLPAPSQSAKTIPVMRATVIEDRLPLTRFAPELPSTLTDAGALRPAQDTQPQLRR
jgi:hypothetical protein